ncbi:MAG: transposase [Planctomycetaceae bacterium]
MPRVIDILREHVAGFVARHPSAACAQVQSTLAKISFCRTQSLGASWHWCAECNTGIRIPNSCGDRHCPQCRGAQRVTWVDTMQPLLLPGVDMFEVVFTIPETLSSLTLGNRREMFRLLFHAAWQSLKTVLEKEQQFEAAAAMVLHTWNQHLESHVHLHAVVPGGGPSLKNAEQWKSATPPPHERQDRWWLVDAEDLRAEFRKRFLAGLRRLHAHEQLRLDGDWAYLRDSESFERYLAPLESQAWVTYIEPPPETSQPEDVVKYLARYLTGGPISDRRLVSHDGRHVVFTARKGTTHGGSDETEEVSVPVDEFVRRWCLHILPSGFTKSRRFGGWSSQHRERCMEHCRRLREQPASVDGDGSGAAKTETSMAADNAPHERPCPTCGHGLERLEFVHRTSWKEIFSSDDRPVWYRIRERG